MEEKKNNKFLIAFVIISLIITVIIIWFYNKEDIKYNTSESLSSLKTSLVTDKDFLKLVLINYSESDTMMLSNLLNNIDTTSLQVQNNKYLLSRDDFNKAYEELYGIKSIGLNLNTYAKYLGISEENQIVYFEIEKIENDNFIFIGINDIYKKKNGFVANVYIYEGYTNDLEEEKRIRDEIKIDISKNNYLSQKIIDTYGIDVTNKTIVFKELVNSKFFKYQLISNEEVSNLDLWGTDAEGYFGANSLIAIYAIVGITGIIGAIIIYFKVKNSNL